MKSGGAKMLTSWKEIASHLDVTVRTAQVWEKQRGLPVRRMPGRRSRVYLRIDEYEAWLSSTEEQPTSLTANTAANTLGRETGLRSSAPATRQQAFVRHLTLSLAVILAALWLGSLPTPRVMEAPPPGPPAKGYVSGDTLIIKDGDGAELWRRRFEGGLVGNRYSGPDAPPWFADADGDGTAEVFFAQRPAVPGATDLLFCFTAKGDELWRFVGGGDVAYEGEVFDNIFHTGALRVAHLGDGRRVAVVTSVHFVDEPTQIAVLDTASGELISEYWHSGHIGRKNPALKLADLNGDGLIEIYAVGVSNAREQATLVVLDPSTTRGPSASEEPSEYQIIGLETGTELARAFFPRSSMNRWSNRPYNFAVNVFPNGETIRVSVEEDAADSGNPSIHYELTSTFVLKQISLSDLFVSVHEALFLKERGFPLSVEEELEMLRREGIEVIRPALAAADY